MTQGTCLSVADSISHFVPFYFQMMEDFSGLALPPLFGGHILEAELEPGGVELDPGEVNVMECVYIVET